MYYGYSSTYAAYIYLFAYIARGTLNMKRWRDQTGISGIMGAIDGSHIAIRKPIASGEDYYNRKSYYSINVQGLLLERCVQHADLCSPSLISKNDLST